MKNFLEKIKQIANKKGETYCEVSVHLNNNVHNVQSFAYRAFINSVGIIESTTIQGVLDEANRRIDGEVNNEITEIE